MTPRHRLPAGREGIAECISTNREHARLTREWGEERIMT